MTNPSYLSLGQAAKLVGKSKPTLSNALKTGRLSYVEKTKAGYKIDPAELMRVYGDTSQKTHNNHQSEAEILKIRNEMMEGRLSEAQKTIDDLRKRLDAETDERRKLSERLLLEDQREKQPKGLFARLFGSA